MEKELITYYIGFFKFDDCTFWQKTGMYRDKNLLEENLKTIPYINLSSIIVKDFQLPD